MKLQYLLSWPDVDHGHALDHCVVMQGVGIPLIGLNGAFLACVAHANVSYKVSSL